jgi:hypothetical protein
MDFLICTNWVFGDTYENRIKNVPCFFIIHNGTFCIQSGYTFIEIVIQEMNTFVPRHFELKKMDTNTTYTANKENVHIGSWIEKKVSESPLSVAQFANLIPCKSGNVYKIFGKEWVNPGLLMKISKVLEFDFFSLYSQNLPWNKSNRIHIKLEIDMPEEEWNTGKICEYCKIIRTTKV